MSKVGIPAIDKIANITNGTSDTKQAIITTASFDEILQTEIKKIKEKEQQGQDINNEAGDSFKFKPDEIQTLVYRNGDER